MYRADIAAILDGRLTSEEAAWQIGREHLGHTNNVLAIHRGDQKIWSHESGSHGTEVDNVWVEFDARGVRIERRGIVDGKVHTEILRKWTWPALAAIVRSHLTGAVLAEARAAARERRDEVATRPPAWHNDQRTGEEREQASQRWSAIERRCSAAAAASWEAARPSVQLDLFGGIA